MNASRAAATHLGTIQSSLKTKRVDCRASRPQPPLAGVPGILYIKRLGTLVEPWVCRAWRQQPLHTATKTSCSVVNVTVMCTRVHHMDRTRSVSPLQVLRVGARSQVSITQCRPNAVRLTFQGASKGPRWGRSVGRLAKSCWRVDGKSSWRAKSPVVIKSALCYEDTRYIRDHMPYTPATQTRNGWRSVYQI